MNVSFTTRRARLMSGAALGLAFAVTAAQAQAQTAAGGQDSGPADVQEVVVTGIRASLQNSIDVKQRSAEIVEVVSSEDIGKLPDNSIAESISRLPGLTTQRLDGRSQVLSIRGLAPDFSTTLLNGREQVTTGDNRGVEYDQYPSEVINAVVVYKTPSASLVGQGLSGTVDLRSVRPLDQGRRTIALNARAEYVDLGKLNPDSDDKGYRYSGIYIDQFADNTIGVAVGVAHMNSPTQIQRFNAWGYPTDGGNLVIGGAKPYAVSTTLERTGVIGTVEWRPTDAFRTSLDVFYTKFEDVQLLRGVELPLYWSGAQLQPTRTVTNEMITSGQFNGVKGIVRNDFNTRDADMKSVGWNGQYKTGGWTLIGDLSWSKVKRDDIIAESYSGTGRPGVGATDNIGFTNNGEGLPTFRPMLNYGNAQQIMLTSPQGWGDGAAPGLVGGQDGFINAPSVEDELRAYRVSVARELDWDVLSSIEAGVNYTSREKSLELDRYFLQLKANAGAGNVSVPVPSQYIVGTADLGFVGIPSVLAYDSRALIGSGIYNFLQAQDANLYAFGWAAKEDLTTAYVKANIDHQLGGGLRLGGNVGVQFVRTEQGSSGFGSGPPTTPGGPATRTPVTGGAEYNEVLPSLNLTLRTEDDLLLRVGLSRQMARPRMDEMRASINFSYELGKATGTTPSTGPWGGSGGNPALRPWIANAADISIEKYFAADAYLAASFFYKDLRTYIYNQNRLYDFTGFPYPGGPAPLVRQGIVSIPQNGEGGRLSGAELSGALPFRMFHPVLEGFGATASVSYTDSSVQPDPNDPAVPLPGLSKYVANGTVYYEQGGFQARVSVRHRSRFRGEVSGIGTERLIRYAVGETLVDAQIGYEFREGPMQGLGLLLQAQNLTDEPFITYEAGDERRVIDHQTYGRRILLGVSYKF
jgi:iron complex outermembrane receptor protein